MKAFLDTSVLVATFYGEHERHAASFAIFVGLSRKTGCTAAHCLAETYAVLTGMPGKDRANPDEALLFLADVRERLSIVALSAQEYLPMLHETAAVGIVGGGVYDASLGYCALKAGAEILYTWNLRHFTRLSPRIAARVKTP